MKIPKNKFEEKIFRQLKRNSCKFEYEGEKLSYLISGHYTPDFVAQKKDGTVMYIETKGYLRPEHKRVMVAAKKLHPTIDLRILFYSHRVKDIKWAEKNKIPWSVDTLPKDWLDELR